MTASSEFARIRRLLARYNAVRAPDGAAPIVGNGDDAAVLPSVSVPVLSTDCAVEGIHFRLSFAPMHLLARRAFRAAASDLAAMGAAPKAALSSLVVPESVDETTFDQLVDGLANASQELGMPVVGGNLSRGGELSITTTVLGDCSDGVLTRSGARPGDAVYVTGTLGDAASALHRLLAIQGETAEEAHEDPASQPNDSETWVSRPCRIREGQQLLEFASAAIDVSDGLLQDAGHLAGASGVKVVMEADAIPLGAHASLDMALTGGEDYELLFTTSSSQKPPLSATRIGTCVPCDGTSGERHPQVSVLRNGRPIPLGDRLGYSHFH